MLLQDIKDKVKLLLRGEKPVGRVQVSVPKCWVGTRYGGITISPAGLAKGAVVYSVGTGEDASWDLALIRQYGCEVHGFDPTPKSIAWAKKQKNPAEWHFHEWGLAGHDGTVTFYPPENPEHVSASIVHRPGTTTNTITVPVKRLGTTMRELGHGRLDILKLDIEGAEYEVVDDILATWEKDIPIPQILIEFHHRFFPDGLAKTKRAIDQLNSRGYRIFHVSANAVEYSFIRA